jgi:hypothetical protein
VRYQTDVGLAAGLRYFDRRTLGEGSLVQVAFRAGGEALLGGELRLRGPRGLVGLHAGYDRNRRTLFAPGLRYGADRGRLGVDVEHRVGSFFGRAAGDLRVAVLTPGPEPIPGFVDSTRLLDAGLELGLDTRRKRPYDTGVALVAGASGTRGFDGDPSRFATFRAEGRATIGLADRALGVRLRAAMLEPLGEPVPFDELLSAAGPEQVRGNPPGTLRGHSRLVGSLEYQWMPVVDLEITAFVDHGGAFGERFAGLSRDGFEPSLGGAVRWGDARLQLAWGPGDGVQLLAGVGW